uniref:Uncharacterized protein n=1 Tax=Solanum lycopersicum TaxID=4081 RepID=A0A3Q7J8U3_SOLLC
MQLENQIPAQLARVKHKEIGLEEKLLLDGSSHSGKNLRTRGGHAYSSDYAPTDDWEPSVPFRPSFLLRQIIENPNRVLYDGFPNSIHQCNVGDGSFSVLTKHMQANADPASTGSNKDQFLAKVIYCLRNICLVMNFHAAIVEFVEELLRPTLNFCILSKVAYKKIVEKTVDKVENSFHPNQIPNTAESTEEYFDLSLTKLSNTIDVILSM